MSNSQEAIILPVKGVEDIVNPDLSGIYDYWRGLQDGELLPLSSKVDLLDLKSHLNDIYLFDVLGAGADHRCVYNGNFHKLEKSIVGIGETIGSMPESGLKDRTSLVFNMVAQLGQPVQMNHARSTMEGKEFQVIDILCLPLSDNGEDVSRTLTVMKRSLHQSPLAAGNSSG